MAVVIAYDNDTAGHEYESDVGGEGQWELSRLAQSQELLRELSWRRLYGLADANAGRAGGVV